VRTFVAEHCGLVAGDKAACHCRKRVPAAIQLGRIDPVTVKDATPADLDAAIHEMETLHDAAALVRSISDATAPEEVAVAIRTLLGSGRFRRVVSRP
jgi:hypothetical protein